MPKSRSRANSSVPAAHSVAMRRCISQLAGVSATTAAAYPVLSATCPVLPIPPSIGQHNWHYSHQHDLRYRLISISFERHVDCSPSKARLAGMYILRTEENQGILPLTSGRQRLRLLMGMKVRWRDPKLYTMSKSSYRMHLCDIQAEVSRGILSDRIRTGGDVVGRQSKTEDRILNPRANCASAEPFLAW
jgi:hypothetical protein